MMSILIKQALLDGKKKDILIKGNRISRIADSIRSKTKKVIDAKDMAILPGFMNAHTHAAMNLLRGYADDMHLKRWLEEMIWPVESKLTEEDVYWGTRLACIEMIRTGTTFFSDMYWHFHGTARAVEDAGLRASVSAVFMDMMDPIFAKEQMRANEKLEKEASRYSDRIHYSIGPHSIYTVSVDSLRWITKFTRKKKIPIHIHVSETKEEVRRCKRKYGKRPVELLDEIGFLRNNVIAAHSLWLDEEEFRIMGKRKVNVAINPVSNMKLSNGREYDHMLSSRYKVNVGIGTDGAASNNSLSMLDSMKTTALLAKLYSEPTNVPATEVFNMATKNCARMFGLDTGEIKVGNLADCILVDLKNIFLIPNHNLVSNLVYAADSSCIDTTICDGRILMEKKRIPGEARIKREAEKRAFRLTT